MELKVVVGNAASVLTIGSFFAGAVLCKTFIKKGNTGDIPPMPLISAALCSILWLRYGLYIDDTALIYVNLIGFILNFSYTVCFYIYVPSKEAIQKQMAVVGAFLFLLSFYLMYMAATVEVAKSVSGIIACAGTLLFCASPLFAVGEVLRTKTVASLPFPVIFSSFVVNFLWFIYGVLLHDTFIQVPNGLGALLSAFQLLLFTIYPSDIPKSRIEVS